MTTPGRSLVKLPRSVTPESGPVTVPPDSYGNAVRRGQIVGGKYEIIRLIGKGAIGFVVSARHLELGDEVALKFLRPELLSNAEVVARFAQEARAAARIKSEYVARVLDVGSLPNGAPFIVMEYLLGEDLARVLQTHGPLPMSEAVEYVMQTCEALAAAHSVGIVHRDIKPENLFLIHRAQGMGTIKVLDFGVSKMSLTGSPLDCDAPPLIQTQTPVGSPMYMSPEQIRASKDVDERTDIWSLGCLLHELLTGTTPFESQSITQLTAAILEEEPKSLRRVCPAAPREIEALIGRCLEKKPEDRLQSVAELAVLLYPFGPRRARLSAERCSSMLMARTLQPAELELPSEPLATESMAIEIISEVIEPPPTSVPALVGTSPSSRAVVDNHQESRAFRWVPLACALFGILAFASGFVLANAYQNPRVQISPAKGTEQMAAAAGEKAAPVVQETMPLTATDPAPAPLPSAVVVESEPRTPMPSSTPTPAPSRPIPGPVRSGTAPRSIARAAPIRSRAVLAPRGSGRGAASASAPSSPASDDEVDVGF